MCVKRKGLGHVVQFQIVKSGCSGGQKLTASFKWSSAVFRWTVLPTNDHGVNTEYDLHASSDEYFCGLEFEYLPVKKSQAFFFSL